MKPKLSAPVQTVRAMCVGCPGGGQGGASGLLTFGGCYFVLFTLLGLFQPCVLEEEGRLD